MPLFGAWRAGFFAAGVLIAGAFAPVPLIAGAFAPVPLIAGAFTFVAFTFGALIAGALTFGAFGLAELRAMERSLSFPGGRFDFTALVFTALVFIVLVEAPELPEAWTAALFGAPIDGFFTAGALTGDFLNPGALNPGAFTDDFSIAGAFTAGAFTAGAFTDDLASERAFGRAIFDVVGCEPASLRRVGAFAPRAVGARTFGARIVGMTGFDARFDRDAPRANFGLLGPRATGANPTERANQTRPDRSSAATLVRRRPVACEPVEEPDDGREPLRETDRTRLRRMPERVSLDRRDLHDILDAGFLCHLGLVVDGVPMVIPTSYGRDVEQLIVHGSVASRSLRSSREAVPVCVTITHVDGIVLARSVFEHSVNYRSAMVFGVPEILTGDEKLEGLRVLTEHVVPGQWAYARRPTSQEIAQTTVLRLPLDEVSVKIRSGAPDDGDGPDGELDVWAGEVPLRMAALRPLPDPTLRAGIELAPHLAVYASAMESRLAPQRGGNLK